jgi:predicted RNA-binding protein YlxR (DUF448 family)
MAERTCIVSCSVRDPDDLIRFVAGPDGNVVPDLKRNLPGRGVWVTANRQLVEQAVQKKAFARGLKAPVKADESLSELTDRLLEDAALGALGFARKAGECVTGSSKVEKALTGGKAIAVLHATDGAEDGIRKVSSAAKAAEANKKRRTPVFLLFNSTQLDLALGATNVIHAALNKGGAAQNAVKRIAQLAAYRQTDAARVADEENE